MPERTLTSDRVWASLPEVSEAAERAESALALNNFLLRVFGEQFREKTRASSVTSLKKRMCTNGVVCLKGMFRGFCQSRGS